MTKKLPISCLGLRYPTLHFFQEFGSVISPSNPCPTSVTSTINPELCSRMHGKSGIWCWGLRFRVVRLVVHVFGTRNIKGGTTPGTSKNERGCPPPKWHRMETLGVVLLKPPKKLIGNQGLGIECYKPKAPNPPQTSKTLNPSLYASPVR